MQQYQLFSGPNSLRDPHERLAFWGTAICALPAALLIGYVLHESIGASQVALFIAIAMVYVTLARGRLLGTSVRLHETQYPRVFSIVKRACAALDIPMPLVFVREDYQVPVAALGFGEPYALVLSSHWIELFADDELAFMIGRELGHIAAGHTRYLSLLSVNGNENALISLIFGAWLRRCTISCDKIGLLCCGSLDAAIRAISIASFRHFGRQVDLRAFAEQQAEIDSDSVSRWGVWLGSEPYAPTRIAALRTFAASHAYTAAEEWFLRERDEEPPALAAPGTTTVVDKDCAGWWRRFAAFAIDCIVVAAIIGSFAGAGAKETSTATDPPPTPAATRSPAARSAGPHDTEFKKAVDEAETRLKIALFNPTSSSGYTFWLTVYMAALVVVAGQTFGMMIAGLRVVTTDFRHPGILRTIGRYAIVLFLMWLIAPLSVIWQRVLLHDRWTGTRLVKVERVIARSIGPA